MDNTLKRDNEKEKPPVIELTMIGGFNMSGKRGKSIARQV